MGYSPWGHKESDTTDGLTLSLFTSVLRQLLFQENHTSQPKPSKAMLSTQLLGMEPLALL